MENYYVIIRPLLEENMFSAKEGEIILDINKGHITFKHNGKFMSKTKELEARVNALLSFKNLLVKKYIEISNRIDVLINNLDDIKTQTNSYMETMKKLDELLDTIKITIDLYMSQIDEFVNKIKIFQYSELRGLLTQVTENLKELIELSFKAKECNFLINEINEQKLSNLNANYKRT